MRLVNTDRPYWLVGMTEMTRTFGLELLESVLTAFQPVFYKVIIEVDILSTIKDCKQFSVTKEVILNLNTSCSY